jgi:hypothetical protein
MFDHHLMRLNYDAWQREAEKERLYWEATAGRPGIQERLLLSIDDLTLSFGLWLRARCRSLQASQHSNRQTEPPRPALD